MVKFESFKFVGFGGSFEGNLVERQFLRRFKSLVDIRYQQVQKSRVSLPVMHSNFCKKSHKTAHV
jgi:hypothetical protein